MFTKSNASILYSYLIELIIALSSFEEPLKLKIIYDNDLHDKIISEEKAVKFLEKCFKKLLYQSFIEANHLIIFSLQC